MKDDSEVSGAIVAKPLLSLLFGRATERTLRAAAALTSHPATVSRVGTSYSTPHRPCSAVRKCSPRPTSHGWRKRGLLAVARQGGHYPPGHRPPGHRPPGHRPPGYRPPGHRSARKHSTASDNTHQTHPCSASTPWIRSPISS